MSGSEAAVRETALVDAGELRALGLRVPVLQGGPAGADEAVVFLHGSPGSSHDWDDLLPRVAAFARVVAFDFPGYGGADRPADWDYSPGGYATFIAAALAELGIERAHLVMHDLGGVGALWAAAHPESFASAVVIDTGVFIGFRWHGFARLTRAPVLGEAMAASTTRLGFRTVMKHYNPQPRKLPEEFLERWWRDYDRGTRRAGVHFYRAAPPSSIERLAPTLRQLDRPALVVWGAHDRFLPVEQAELQKKSFPSAEVVIFEDSGHWPFLDDPGRAAEVIVPFIRRHAEAPEQRRPMAGA
jgi:pimeloyl-ACP methyl ester carboxylesterase